MTHMHHFHITLPRGLSRGGYTVVGVLCEDLKVTCLEGKGGESIHHRTSLLVLFVTYSLFSQHHALKSHIFNTCSFHISAWQVFELEGIPILVTLLRSSSPGVSQAAAGALRNLVFKHHDNKLEVQHCSGIAKALQLLKETDSTETQKQITGRVFFFVFVFFVGQTLSSHPKILASMLLTLLFFQCKGLLWNLSSADELKGELIATALPALTDNVVVPFTCWSDSSANNNIHPDVFYSATGCLRWEHFIQISVAVNGWFLCFEGRDQTVLWQHWELGLIK